jgi:hypothetical protein
MSPETKQINPVPFSTGVKFDKGKTRFSLLPMEIIEALAVLFTRGAEKYEAHNWKKMEDTSRYYDAMMRHMINMNNEDPYDRQTGVHHAVAFAWNALCLAWKTVMTQGKPFYLKEYNLSLKEEE